MDGISLERILVELRSRLVGAYLGKPRLCGPHAVSFEVSREKGRLLLDASRRAAGLALLPRESARELESCGVPAGGRAQQALLRLRKELDGARVHALERVAGERTLLLDAGQARLVLRLSGAPALTLAVSGEPLATLGEGAPAWPPPAARPEREWQRLEAHTVEEVVRRAVVEGRRAARALLAACPELGPALARYLEDRPGAWPALRAALERPTPVLMGPPGIAAAALDDRAILRADAIDIAPAPLEWPGREAAPQASWLAAVGALVLARRRGELFERRLGRAADALGRERARLLQLEANLLRDGERLPEAAELRRQGQALLAAAHIPEGVERLELPDPWGGPPVPVTVDPRASRGANADRLFDRARRSERARVQIGRRLEETRAALASARERERRLGAARWLRELPADEAPAVARARLAERARASRYLTSGGLLLLVGRNARENQRLTFEVARPDDLWFHARDVPGSHVVLRDPQRRAAERDTREAAEVAAFLSEARASAAVDVHMARRKHLRSGRGGPGRVLIAHSETLRVAPLDPEGRLRRG